MFNLIFIDDDYASHVYHREMAESAGFNTANLTFFFDADEAIIQLKSIYHNQSVDKWPSYIFVDLNMPGKSGYDFVDELKLTFPLENIPPIFVVSTTKNSYDVEKVKKEPMIKGFETKFLDQDFFRALLKNTVIDEKR